MKIGASTQMSNLGNLEGVIGLLRFLVVVGGYGSGSVVCVIDFYGVVNVFSY